MFSGVKLPVDPGIPKRPIRFKYENPLSWVSQNFPANVATGQLQNVNKQNQSGAWYAEAIDRTVIKELEKI